ncbi:MAG: ferritin-like domain-containing protein, partial [Rhodospirillaceae bacterium]|nr:ferritin-like domain-containing protein [Rhodospirillaceae bacterium]
MTQTTELASERTILDRPEQRFPLKLAPEIPHIRSLFHASAKNQWDPKTDVDWDLLDLSQYSEEQLRGAREFWSRRAWSEYGAISESPALQIRFCQDRLEPDLQLYFTIRTQEESRHAEACHMMAEKLGGYIEEPYVNVYEKSVSTHGVRAMALDPNTPLEAIIAALVCAAEEFAFDVFKHLYAIGTNPVSKQILRLVMRDEVRHCAFGWTFMEHRIKSLTPEQIKKVEEAVIVMVRDVELNGYHRAWLAPETPASILEVEADRLSCEAGLGASVEELDIPVIVA